MTTASSRNLLVDGQHEVCLPVTGSEFATKYKWGTQCSAGCSADHDAKNLSRFLSTDGSAQAGANSVFT